MVFLLNERASVNMFGCVTHDRGSWHSGRCLNTHLILYVAAGVVSMQIGDAHYRAEVGDVLFIPHGTPYRPTGDEGCTYYVFHFDMEEAETVRRPGLAVSALDENCRGFAYVFDSEATDGTVTLDTLSTPADRAPIEEIFLRAAKLDLLHDPTHKMKLDVYFRRFLYCMAHTHRSAGEVSETVRTVISYIHDHLRAPLSLCDISAHLFLSESYIARVFKREMGESVGAYISKQKINLACALLINTDMSITEIAEEIGISSPYYFSSVFARQMGMSPTAYRKRT